MELMSNSSAIFFSVVSMCSKSLTHMGAETAYKSPARSGHTQMEPSPACRAACQDTQTGALWPQPSSGHCGNTASAVQSSNLTTCGCYCSVPCLIAFPWTLYSYFLINFTQTWSFPALPYSSIRQQWAMQALQLKTLMLKQFQWWTCSCTQGSLPSKLLVNCPSNYSFLQLRVFCLTFWWPSELGRK